MKKRIIAVGIVLSVFCSVGVCAVGSGSAPDARRDVDENVSSQDFVRINTEDLQDLLGSGKRLALVDCRKKALDDGFRIPRAGSIRPDEEECRIERLLRLKAMPIIVYGLNKESADAVQLVKKLVQLDYKSVYLYEDGIDGWREAGNAVFDPRPPKR